MTVAAVTIHSRAGVEFDWLDEGLLEWHGAAPPELLFEEVGPRLHELAPLLEEATAEVSGFDSIGDKVRVRPPSCGRMSGSRAGRQRC